MYIVLRVREDQKWCFFYFEMRAARTTAEINYWYMYIHVYIHAHAHARSNKSYLV